MSALLTDTGASVAPIPAPDNWLGAWETSADAAYCRDLDGSILAVNVSFARKFGRDRQAFVRTKITDLIHADDIALFQSVSTALLQPPFRGTNEQRWQTPQGLRWFSWQETAMTNAQGIVIGFRAVGRDATRQHLAEEQFYRLSRAVEQSPVSIVITDVDGRAQYVNSKFTEVSGHTLEDLIERKIAVLRQGHSDDDSYQEFMAELTAQGEWRGEVP